MKKRFKKIKDTNSEDRKQFAKEFFSPTNPNKIPSFLTLSEELQKKTLRVDHVSGSLTGMGLNVFREDKKDVGSPINVDIIRFENDELIQFKPPFDGHWMTFLPPQKNELFVICPKCKIPFLKNNQCFSCGSQFNQF